MSESENKELPLSALRLSFAFHTATAPVFFDIHGEAVCVYTARHSSIANIERHLEEAHLLGYEVYLYKLYEKLQTYTGGTPEKAIEYTLRLLIQARRGPDGKFVTATEQPERKAGP